MSCSNCGDVKLPGFSLSIVSDSQDILNQSSEPRKNYSESDAEQIISVAGHSVHWLLCLESYQQRRRLYVGRWWTLIYHDLESCIYYQGCVVIVAFRGTKSPRDLYDDTLITLGKIYPRASQAISYIMELQRLNPKFRVELTGHSLGGAIARDVGKVLGLRVVTFNAAAPPSAPAISGKDEVDYHIVFDLISAWQSPNTVRIDKGFQPISSWWDVVVPFKWVWHLFTGILPSHSLVNFSNESPGVVVSAEMETVYMRKWFNSLPSQARVYVLVFLLGSRGYGSHSLPPVE